MCIIKAMYIDNVCRNLLLQSNFSHAHKIGNNGINANVTYLQFSSLSVFEKVSKCEIRCQLVKGITF